MKFNLDIDFSKALKKGVDKRDSDIVSKEEQKESTKISDRVILNKIINQCTLSLKSLKELCELPKKQEQYRIITHGSFNALDFILLVLKQRSVIDEIFITTFSFGLKSATTFGALLHEGQIKKATILINSSFKKRNPDLVVKIKAIFDNKKAAYVFNWNHSKIILMRAGNDYFVLEGSGNLAKNAQIEQYLFENNKDAYSFHSNWIEEASLK